MGTIEVTRTYLEMTDAGQLRASTEPECQLRLDRVDDCPASFARSLYREVGGSYHWVDRAEWTDEQWYARLRAQGVSLWVLRLSGTPAGYCEFHASEDRSIEIAYLGLLPDFTGKGLGKALLRAAVRQAWADGARRVWLHTCSLDAPAALPNYLVRGFTKFREERYLVDL